MKKRTKILLPTTALALGLGAFAITGELGEGTEASYTSGAQNEYKTGDVYISEKSAEKNHGKHGAGEEVEGKVITLSKNSLTVDVPFQEEKTFKMSASTKIEDKPMKKLEEGALVEVDARNDEAYKIDIEKSIETEGILIEVTEQNVTLEREGVQKTFKKAAGFRIDADDYSGALEGLHSEIKLDEKFEVKELEIDEEDDD